MDWMIIIAFVSGVVSAVSIIKYLKLKKDVYLFEKRLEISLDDIILGRELKTDEETEDTLFGKCIAKLHQMSRIWIKTEQENMKSRAQMKSLISDISHQTKTPLANIKVYLGFLQEEELTDKRKEFLGKVEKQTDKLEFLLQSMVKMSRLETGVIQVQTKITNLFSAIGKAVEEIVPAAAHKRIELYVECDETLSIVHDSKWTEEAVFNILDNAVKYTETGGKIHICVMEQEIFTKISIRDTGKGIVLNRQAEIFKRFYREPEVHDESGIGIGLYLARKIMELQNGYIEVRSELGQGAEFCLYLPKHTGDETEK